MSSRECGRAQSSDSVTHGMTLSRRRAIWAFCACSAESLDQLHLPRQVDSTLQQPLPHAKVRRCVVGAVCWWLGDCVAIPKVGWFLAAVARPNCWRGQKQRLRGLRGRGQNLEQGG